MTMDIDPQEVGHADGDMEVGSRRTTGCGSDFSIIQYRISFHLPVLFMEVVVELIHFMGVVMRPILSIE